MWRRQPLRACGRRPSLVARLRDWWDLHRGRRDRVLARIDPFGGLDEPYGGAPVREPRRPLRPTLSGSAALDLPED
jgi:hypothetical protein